MNRSLQALAAVALTASTVMLPASAHAAAASITVQANKPGHAISPTLWGIFFEDINLSVDGGIYPELVRNRSFEDSEKPDQWTLESSGGIKGELAIDQSKPLNPMNRRSLRMRITGDGEGAVTLVNKGYWGMGITKDAEYRFSVAAKRGDGFKGPLDVVIEGKSGEVLAKGTVDGLGDNWKTFNIDLKAASADSGAKLVIRSSQKGTVWLDMVSLIPKATWKGHGLRTDLCEMLDGMKPKFVRFPGGCWVEGNDLAHSYRWKETIGDISHRRPLFNLWQYNATHGVGYLEYLILCEDLGAEPLFVINCGMSHTEVVPMDQMGPLVQDALDSIEYANGSTNTVWGALRAKHGHPAPFRLRYFEIGNENGGPAYHERYNLMYRAIKARYPEVNLIANEWGGAPKDSQIEILDEHYYNTPEFFMQQAGRYDKYDRKGPKIYVGEYAVTQNCGLGNLRGAIGEAAFMTGMERNSDVVTLASYAPLFANVNYKKWNPNLINFDPSRVYGLPSYYVQKMFSDNRGDNVLPITVESSPTAIENTGGAVGVGTWLTQAEFKDIKVTKNGQTLYTSDFAKGTEGWKFLGGDWKAQDGVLRQTVGTENIRAIIGDNTWSDYTYSLKARKISGDEGFLILFRAQDENAKAWWNIGGWGNSRHGIEMGGIVGKDVPGKIETGRWYDIRVELKGQNIRCYLDGKLIHDVTAPSMKSLYASASQVKASHEVILKVVNGSTNEQSTEIRLDGVKLAGPIQATVLTSEKGTDENTLDQPTKVAPVSKTIEAKSPAFKHSFPGNSVTVLRVKTK